MKQFTPRDFIRNGMKEAMDAAINGEAVYIVPGRSKNFGTPNPRAIHNYGEKVCRTRFKLVVVDQVDEEWSRMVKLKQTEFGEG